MQQRTTLPRYAELALAQTAAALRVAVITGARQSGKSTLVRSSRALTGYHYLTLDNLDTRQRASAAPQALLTQSDRMIIDEIQRAPDLLLLIKELVDQDPPAVTGRFILTGSADLLSLKHVGETLAGRAGYVTLWPMTQGEIRGTGQAGCWSDLLDAPVAEWRSLLRDRAADRENWREIAKRGGYPTPALHLSWDGDRARWFQGYIDTYLHRDVPEVLAVSNPLDLHRLIQRVVLDIGQLEHQARWATELGLQRATVCRWLDQIGRAHV